MEHCETNLLDQFILPPDISGVTQKYDQINQLLHATYEKKKSKMYSDINKECFMNIISEVWNEWANPERSCKAEKRVGVAKDGLNYKWMDHEKLNRQILNPPTPSKTLEFPINLPKGVREDTVLLTGSHIYKLLNNYQQCILFRCSLMTLRVM